ncbi:MAG: CoA ester lyase [Hyphomicrobiaceae bacterium]|nr:CoA ester lyase [Hyphomicrobiaceae bacterium]
MRSLLFVPGDSARKLEKGLASGTDVLICDLEDSVAAGDKAAARAVTLGFLREAMTTAGRPKLFVRLNALDSGQIDADLDAVIPAGPDGVMLPKAGGGRDIAHLGAKLAVREAEADLADGATRIVAVATETAASVFGLGTYAGASRRLDGIAWGGEDLGADIGVLSSKDEAGGWTEPFRMVRNLCLFGAVSAGIAPIDTVHTAFRDLEALERECRIAARDGFTAKMAIHPAQVAVINAVFTPSPTELERARRIIAAFAQAGNAGVIGLDGEMLDRPHLKRAERLLARAG